MINEITNSTLIDRVFCSEGSSEIEIELADRLQYAVAECARLADEITKRNLEDELAAQGGAMKGLEL